VLGDPHFKTWTGESYDFHGVCDLVLLKNDGFANNLGMKIHIRTTKMRKWSYVSVGAVRIGQDTLEVMGGRKENRFWVNGIKGSDKKTLSGYPFHFKQVNRKNRQFTIDIGEKEKILVGTWNSFVRIEFENVKSKQFEDSMGLMGSFSTGTRLARDNVTLLNDFNIFGQEWQVLDSEPKLFHDVKGPQHPKKCQIPSSLEMRRRLSEAKITKEDAKKACAHVSEAVMDLCVFDVMVTNDASTMGAY